MFLVAVIVSAQSSTSDWERLERELEDQYEALSADLEGQWQAFSKAQEEKWRKLREEVERKWDEFVRSTEKVWVNYRPNLSSRSQVDFEQGKVKLEAIVAVKQIKQAQKELAAQMQAIFNDRNQARVNPLDGMLKTPSGQDVTGENLKEFVQTELVPKARVEGKPYKGKDGVERIKVAVTIDMIPRHLEVRARKYLKEVRAYATHFHLQPHVIMAVIHTESYFNPLAESPAMAFGLMQLIPRYGARDAYKFVYGKDVIVTPQYLFVPENNVELGAAYLSLLREQHFGGIKDPLKNLYLSLCGYNWGPTRVTRRVLYRYQVHTMRPEELFVILSQKTPEETKDYLRKVTKRTKIYEPMFR